MPRPCVAQHPPSPATCRLCHWCVTPGEPGATYRRDWGEPAIAGDGPDLSCRARGGVIGSTPCGECGLRDKALPVHSCDIHGKCVVEGMPRDMRNKMCRTCDDRQPVTVQRSPGSRLTYYRGDDLVRDSARLAGRLPRKVRAIAGVPRSGMMPAGYIATRLNLPLYQAGEDGRLIQLSAGTRGHDLARLDGPIAIVDDTVASGGAMRRLRGVYAQVPAVYCAVYVARSQTSVVDYWGREDDCQLTEWNWPNNFMLQGDGREGSPWRGGFALDMDGVICEEPTVPDADDGPLLEQYLEWMRNARPHLLPRRFAVPLIVTGRLERWRSITEDWLRAWGVKWDRLVMHQADTASARNKAGDIAHIKGREFAASACSVFMESDYRQCLTIGMRSGKPVICPTTGQVWQ